MGAKCGKMIKPVDSCFVFFSKKLNEIAKNSECRWSKGGKKGHGSHEGCGCADSWLFAVLSDCIGHCLLKKQWQKAQKAHKGQ